MSHSQSDKKTPPRRSERLSNRDRPSYIDSDDDDDDLIIQGEDNHTNDREWQPEPTQVSLNLTPASNIVARGTQLSRQGKQRVTDAAEEAGTGNRCALTSYSGFFVQHSHVVPRSVANDLDLIRRLEWCWGCYEGTLNLDSSRNIMKLHAFRHLLMDSGHVLAFVPPLPIVMAVRKDANVLGDYPNRPTAERKHFLDVLPSNKSWTYRVLPLQPIEDHPIMRKLPNRGFEIVSLDQFPRIEISSHVHPYFVILAAGYHFVEANVKLSNFTDKEEKSIVNTIKNLYIEWTSRVPPPWFGDLQKNPPPKDPDDKRPLNHSPGTVINQMDLSDGELSPSARSLQSKQLKLSIRGAPHIAAKEKSKSVGGPAQLSDHSQTGRTKATPNTVIVLGSLTEPASRAGIKAKSVASLPFPMGPPNFIASSSTSGSIVSLPAMGPPPPTSSDTSSGTPEISMRPNKRARPEDEYSHSAGSTSLLRSTRSAMKNPLQNSIRMQATFDHFLQQLLLPQGSAEYRLGDVEGTLTFTPRSPRTSGANSDEMRAGPSRKGD